MFQNIDVEEKIDKEENKQDTLWEKPNKKEILKKIFTVQNILVYIISFMLSTVSTVNGMAPFALAILAAALSNGLPTGVVFAVTLIRNYNRNRHTEKH